MATPRNEDVAYAGEVASYLVRRHAWLPEQAIQRITKYKESLERFGTKARSRAPSLGLLKGDWGKVRGAILEVNNRQRKSGKRPAAKPRLHGRRPDHDPIPDWAKEPDAPVWLVLDMAPGTALGGTPGWFGHVQGRTGHWFAFSQLEGEDKWYADSHFGPGSWPFFAHGMGSRSVAKSVAKDPLNTYLNRAKDLATQGQAGPYDPRYLGPVDAPGQQRMFNPPRKGDFFVQPQVHMTDEEARRQAVLAWGEAGEVRFGPPGPGLYPSYFAVGYVSDRGRFTPKGFSTKSFDEAFFNAGVGPSYMTPNWMRKKNPAGLPTDLSVIHLAKANGGAACGAGDSYTRTSPRTELVNCLACRRGNPDAWEPWDYAAGDPDDFPCHYCRRAMSEAPRGVEDEEKRSRVMTRDVDAAEATAHEYCIPGPRQYDPSLLRSRYDNPSNASEWSRVEKMTQDEAREFLS